MTIRSIGRALAIAAIFAAGCSQAPVTTTDGGADVAAGIDAVSPDSRATPDAVDTVDTTPEDKPVPMDTPPADSLPRDVGANDVADSSEIDAQDAAPDDVAPDDVPDDVPAADTGCGPGQTLCGARCVNTNTSIDNCGACGAPCPRHPSGTTVCSAGVCGYLCQPGFGDCDGDLTNGCEADLLHDAAHCNDCGTACAATPNATAACNNGACATNCDPSFGDCDGDPSNGCETSLDGLNNCGACGTTCPATTDPTTVPACGNGQCGFDCIEGAANCDFNASNGCECGASPTRPNVVGSCVLCTMRGGCQCQVRCAAGSLDCDNNISNGCNDLQTDPANCGGCGTACPQVAGAHMAPACVAGVCGAQCDVNYADCNGDPADGCETFLGSGLNCGACRGACPPRYLCCATRGGPYTCAHACM